MNAVGFPTATAALTTSTKCTTPDRTDFTRPIGANAADPNFDGLVDGWKLASAGYKLWEFMLDRKESANPDKAWKLQLGLMQKPKPILPK
jgi:hypothetical protein